MATLYEYFDSDFSHTLKAQITLTETGLCPHEGYIHYDFAGHLVFLSFYLKQADLSFSEIEAFVKNIHPGKTQASMSGKIGLPAARTFHGQLRVQNNNPIGIQALLFGDTEWLSANDLQGSSRVYVYSETPLDTEQVKALKKIASSQTVNLQFRSMSYVAERTKHEKPLAFISHDSRDKEIAKKIAINLQRMMCPVWYDEFTLKVGDNLRDSIESGLKSCKKCILVLSDNFFKNKGWTKKEFDSIFTREILERKKLVLPVWVGVNQNSVYDYSPSLANVKALDWQTLGEEEVSRLLHQVILSD